MIARITKSRTLTKHILRKCKCKFDDRKCNLNQKWDNSKCCCECNNPKEHCVCKNGYFWNPATCGYKNGNYVGSIIGDSEAICDKNHFNKKYFNKNCSNKFLYFTSLFINYHSIIDSC